MLGIGAFSKICMVSVKTLRHYSQIGLLPPAYIDPDTGYRYYESGQLSRMLLIQRLKRYCFSLDEIKSILACQDPDLLSHTLAEQLEKLRRQLADTQTVISELERHLLSLERTGDMMSYQNQYEIHLVETEPVCTVSSRQRMGVAEFGAYYGKLFEKIAREHLHPTGQTLAIYHDREFDPADSDIEVAVAVERSEASMILPGRLCVSTTHRGPYSSLSDAYGAITKWLETSEYQIADAPYEIYRKNQFDHLPPEQWETDIFFPVKKQ